MRWTSLPPPPGASSRSAVVPTRKRCRDRTATEEGSTASASTTASPAAPAAYRPAAAFALREQAQPTGNKEEGAAEELFDLRELLACDAAERAGTTPPEVLICGGKVRDGLQRTHGKHIITTMLMSSIFLKKVSISDFFSMHTP